MCISKISAHNALFAACIQVYVTYLDVFMETIAIPPTGIHCDSVHKEGHTFELDRMCINPGTNYSPRVEYTGLKQTWEIGGYVGKREEKNHFGI